MNQSETTQKLKKYISLQRQSRYISSKVLLAKEIGITPQMLYIKLKKDKWTNTDIHALNLLTEISIDKNNVSLSVLRFIENQKKQKEQNKITIASIAKKLEVSVSLLYKRMKSHNWKSEEIIKIDEL